MLIAESDATIESKSSSFTALYCGCLRFMFTNYDEQLLESVNSVKIVRIRDSQTFEIWNPKKSSLIMVIHNISEKKMNFLFQHEFLDGRGYELEETIELLEGEMRNIAEVRVNSMIQIKILHSIVEGNRVYHDKDILFFSIQTT
jgi:hypothetical protein